MNRIVIYIIGALLLTTGLGYAAHMMGVPPIYIGIGALIVIGLGIMGAASSAHGTAKTNVHVDEG